MGFKAILHLCQVAGNGAAHSTPTGFYLRETHCSHNVRADRRISSSKLNFLVSFEAFHCVKLISCK